MSGSGLVKMLRNGPVRVIEPGRFHFAAHRFPGDPNDMAEHDEIVSGMGDGRNHHGIHDMGQASQVESDERGENEIESR